MVVDQLISADFADDFVDKKKKKCSVVNRVCFTEYSVEEGCTLGCRDTGPGVFHTIIICVIHQ